MKGGLIKITTKVYLEVLDEISPQLFYIIASADEFFIVLDHIQGDRDELFKSLVIFQKITMPWKVILGLKWLPHVSTVVNILQYV